MSIGSRIRELRIKNGITQEDLAKTIGVTKGAIANYENEVSSPKIDLMYKLFDALDCDANYLYQDDMKELYKDKSTPEEFEKIIKKYRSLDPYGQETVNITLDREIERVERLKRMSKRISAYASQLAKLYNSMPDTTKVDIESEGNTIEWNLNAAQARTDIDIPEGVDTSENDIMDSEDF